MRESIVRIHNVRVEVVLSLLRLNAWVVYDVHLLFFYSGMIGTFNTNKRVYDFLTALYRTADFTQLAANKPSNVNLNGSRKRLKYLHAGTIHLTSQRVTVR